MVVISEIKGNLLNRKLTRREFGKLAVAAAVSIPAIAAGAAIARGVVEASKKNVGEYDSVYDGFEYSEDPTIRLSVPISTPASPEEISLLRKNFENFLLATYTRFPELKDLEHNKNLELRKVPENEGSHASEYDRGLINLVRLDSFSFWHEMTHALIPFPAWNAASVEGFATYYPSSVHDTTPEVASYLKQYRGDSLQKDEVQDSTDYNNPTDESRKFKIEMDDYNRAAAGFMYLESRYGSNLFSFLVAKNIEYARQQEGDPYQAFRQLRPYELVRGWVEEFNPQAAKDLDRIHILHTR